MTSIAPNPEAFKRDDPLKALRVSLEFVARNYSPHDIVGLLGEVLDDHGDYVALKYGDYGKAADLKIIARYLDRLPLFIDNYDPTEE